MENLSIKIRIGDREYPMKVRTDDEERIRQAGKLIQEKIKNYREKFGIDDTQDLLAMVAFDCVVDQIKMEVESSELDHQALSQVSKINQLLADRL